VTGGADFRWEVTDQEEAWLERGKFAEQLVAIE
jgi:hypothetical protein